MGKMENKSTQILRALPDAEQLTSDLVGAVFGSVESVSFLCYDIVLLRKINHAYGRAVGDTLLADVAQWVMENLPAGRLYRVDGDLFCVVYQNENIENVYRYANMLDARFEKVWNIKTQQASMDVYTTVSVAVLGDLDKESVQELPSLFERALDIAKGSRQVVVYNEEYDNMTQEHVRLQMELKTCILSDMQGFSVAYQPISNPATGTWKGLEALCRWSGPQSGAVPPNIFIKEAEEMGLISQLGGWMLDTAVANCVELGLDKLDGFFISVNVSAMQMAKHNYVRSVIDVVEKYQFPYEKLVLEITESTQFTFNEMSISAVELLRAKGVMFALDDFGSGYSGFSNLKNLPVDLLKTDREFTDNIENDAYLQYFYYIMAETAHANGMRMIAEGIETSEQLRSVVKNGADYLQGYLLGRPMDKATLAEQLDKFAQPLDEFCGWQTSMSDFQHWVNGRDAYMITPSLFRLQSKCIGIMLDEENMDDAMNKILQTVGQYFKVGRVYVFLRDEGTVFSNRYEWCAEGVEAQIDLFQEVDGMEDGFYDVLCENDVVMASSEEDLPGNLRARLTAGGQRGSVCSMLVMPMKRRGEILGFVGYDEARNRDWLPEEMIILHNLCLLCLLILVKTERK